MTHEAAWLTGPQLLAFAAQQGRAISPAQFKRWRLEGLLPLAVRKGRGRAHGVEGRYAPTLLTQLLAVADALGQSRDLDAVRFRLWWQGYDVDTERVRDGLARVLDEFDEQRRFVHRVRADDDLSNRFEQSTNKRLSDATMGSIRRRVGKRGYPSFVMLLYEVVAGEYTGYDDADTALLEKGFGAAGAPVPINAVLAGLAKFLRPAQLRRTLTDATQIDLVQARDELKPVLARVQALSADEVSRAFGVAAPHLITGSLAQLGDREFMQCLVLWLSVRQLPYFRPVYDFVIPWLSRPVSEWPAGPIPLPEIGP